MMQSQTISGTLQYEKAPRPSFGVVILNWLIYFFVSRFLMMMWPNLLGFFLRYLVLFIALTTTFSYILTPEYYSIFRPSKIEPEEIQKISLKPIKSDDSKSTSTFSSKGEDTHQKITTNSSNSVDSESTAASSSIEGDAPQKQVISSDNTTTSRFCPECGTKMEPTGHFCTACGSPIRI